MDKRHEANRIVREKICHATFQLMHEKAFSSITVTEIIRKAGVARVSFYRNFASKEEVVRSQLAATIDNILAQVQKSGHLHSYENVLQFWKYLAEQKESLAKFCTAELSELLMDFLAKPNIRSDSSGGIEEDYCFTAYIGALYNMLRKWLCGGCKESPETMARIFCGMWDSGSVPAEA